MFARWRPKHGVSIMLVTECVKIYENFDKCHQQRRHKFSAPTPNTVVKVMHYQYDANDPEKISVAMSCWTPHHFTKSANDIWSKDMPRNFQPFSKTKELRYTDDGQPQCMSAKRVTCNSGSVT